MGRLSKIKRELIEEANRRLLGEIQKDSTDLLYMSARGMTNLDFIVDYIWEPNTPVGYSMGENGQALTDYIEKTFNGQDEAYADHIWICSPNQKDCTNKFAIKADGEYIYIYKCIEQPKLPFTKDKICPVIDELGHWGGDSTGGRGYDEEDIKEIFETLGLSSHLSETR